MKRVKKNPLTGKIFNGCAVTLIWFAAGSAGAAEAGAAATNLLADLSLEELVNVKVTSVSKKEEKLDDAAAAIFVLSNDDLRRSGATSIAEALRMVPGLNVAVGNAGDWAISSRGFSALYSDKLLVMVDGRTVYSPIFAGVFWDLQQMDLEDVDRVEVIRGPGGTIWGANAMNGVINVVSKSAKDTQGTYLDASGGDVHLTMDSARYGGKIGENTYYRVDGGYQLTDDYPLANGQSAGDGWQSERGGFRIDNYPSADTHLTWQADTVVNQLADNSSDAYNVNTVGRWTRELSERSSVEVQAYYDRTYRNDVLRTGNTVDTIDLTAQHTFGLGERNDVIWGVGYRFAATTETEQPNTRFVVTENSASQSLFNVFVQDQFKLIPDKLTFTAGVKLEHNDFTGLEVEPSFRAMFKPTENQTLWAAISRAVRTPDETEAADLQAIIAGAPFIGPGGGLYISEVTSGGHPRSEVLWAYEMGYRIQPLKRVSVDVSTYYNEYSDLISFDPSQVTFIPGTPGVAAIPWANTQHGYTYGGEASVTVSPLDNWRLTASYSLVKMDIVGIGLDNAAPEQQVMLRSSCDFTKQISLDAELRYVDEIPAFQFGPVNSARVPAYVTADVRLAYRPTKNLELSLVGQNLFDGQHSEQPPGEVGSIGSEAPRGFYAKIAWHF